MKKITRLFVILFIAGSCTAAHAQIGGFSIGNILGGKKGNSGPDIGSVASNLVKATKETTEEEEIVMGQQTASVVLGARPLWTKDPEGRAAQRYINTLGRWIASHSERPDLPWTFGVLDDPGFNAFATPGGYIFVTRGLLENVRNEAELAGVLGHEIAHVTRKHHLKAVQSSAWFNLGTDLVAAKVGKNEMFTDMIKKFVVQAYASGLSQSDELDADRVGVVLAARAGFDPFGLPSVLQTLQSQSGEDSGFSLLFKTHPHPATRLEELDKAMTADFDRLPGTAGKPFKDRLHEFRK